MADLNTGNATGGDNTQGDGKAAGTQNGADNKASEGTKTDTSTGQDGGNQQQPKTFTQEEVNRMLAKERKDAEKKAADAEAKAKLSEDERTKAELAEARQKLQERDNRDFVQEKAEKAGVKNPKLFYNAYKSELEFDAKGKITNLNDVLETAKAESPELFQIAQKQQGSADGGSGKDTPTTLTKEQIEKMSPAEVAANMEAIDKFLASQK